MDGVSMATTLQDEGEEGESMTPFTSLSIPIYGPILRQWKAISERYDIDDDDEISIFLLLLHRLRLVYQSGNIVMVGTSLKDKAQGTIWRAMEKNNNKSTHHNITSSAPPTHTEGGMPWMK